MLKLLYRDRLMVLIMINSRKEKKQEWQDKLMHLTLIARVWFLR